MKLENIQIKDLPDQLLEKAWQQILPYEVGLIGVTRKRWGEETQLVGSGTFIQVQGTFGILTAHHVVVCKHFRESTHLGLCFLSGVHKPVFEIEYLRIIKIAKPKKASEGPDLAAIILPSTNIGSLKAQKQFWNLSLKRQEVLPNPLDRNIGVWFFCGYPDEFTKKEPPQRGFDEVIGYFNLRGFFQIEREWVDGEYDYLDIPVPCGDKGKLPESFGGMSGGGLWQIPLDKADDGTIKSKEPIFSGVAFYQTGIVNRTTTIRCHGRRSVYEMVYNALKDIA